MRQQPGNTRRRVQRAKTLGCYPPLVSSRSLPASPNAPRALITASGVPAAIGLDCFELRRRNRNAEITGCLSHVSRVAATDRAANATHTTSTPIEVNLGGERAHREGHGPRRIQSLNRYTNTSSKRASCQLSWENLSTKPPRPPTTHSSATVSPPRFQAFGFVEIPTRRVDEMVNKEEGWVPTKANQYMLKENSSISDTCKLVTTTDIDMVSLCNTFSLILLKCSNGNVR